MQLSKFIKSFSIPDQPGNTLIYSTKKTSMVLLPDEDFRRLKKNESLPQYEEDLKDLGILVPNHHLEFDEVSGFYKKLNHYNHNINASVVLGMKCNFDCLYCYEGTLKGNSQMSDQTADRLISFLQERFTGEKNRIHLDFYGGEPLLYIDRLKYIAKALKEFVEKKGGSFDFTLVTNGSLLTQKVVLDLKKYGLNYIKVTIDGLPLNHNRFRPFKGGAPSFEVIVNNLSEVCGLVDIGLGGNFTSSNYRQFPLLLDKLRCSGIRPDKIKQVSFNVVAKVNDQYCSPKYSGGCLSSSEPWLPAAYTFIRREVMKRGYFVAKLRPEVCAIGIDDSFAVNYDGSLYKCLPLVGRKQFKIGDIVKGIGDFFKTHHLDNWQKEEKCKDCVYLPLCFGGCRYMQYQKTGSMAGVECMKNYFDNTLESLIIQDLQYRKADSLVSEVGSSKYKSAISN